jgi:hypothetical protein
MCNLRPAQDLTAVESFADSLNQWRDSCGVGHIGVNSAYNGVMDATFIHCRGIAIYAI